MRQADAAARRIDAGRLGGPLTYLAGWVGAGLVVGWLAVALLGHGHEQARGAAVPPIREIALGTAARKAGCAIHRRRSLRAGAGAVARPPGGRIYGRPVSAVLRERAVRGGLIVIEYRVDVNDGSLDTLKALQQAVPAGTILAPSRAQPLDALIATSLRRQLVCTRMTSATYDALLLFRGRYLGSAPRS